MSSDATLKAFILYARFKGALHAGGHEHFSDEHWVLVLRAMHVFGDDDDKNRCQEDLARLGSEPDDELIHNLYSKWHAELNGATHHFRRWAGSQAKR